MLYVGTVLFSSLKGKNCAVIDPCVLQWSGKKTGLFCRGRSVRWFRGLGCWTVFASIRSTGCVVFLILSRFCFLMLACATLLVLRVTAWCFWSLSKGVTSPDQRISVAVGAVLYGPGSWGLPPASRRHERAQCAPCWSFCYLLLAGWQETDFAHTLSFAVGPLWQGWVLWTKFSSLLWECSLRFAIVVMNGCFVLACWVLVTEY